MAMGTRKTEQPPLWVATADLPSSPGHPFYAKLSAILDAEGFDRFSQD
jgi:transposase